MTSLQIIQLLWDSLLETLVMTFISSLIAYIIGLPLGIILVTSSEKGILPNRLLNKSLGLATNFLRSVPFLILLVWIMPFTRVIVGTTIGLKGVIVPLVIAAFPFIARLVESSLNEVDAGLIEAAQAMGATNWQIITKVMLVEAKPSLLVGAALAVTTILGYSAMAGFCGAGGLGAVAINNGYRRYDNKLMILTVLILAVVLQLTQEFGLYLAKKIDKRHLK